MTERVGHFFEPWRLVRNGNRFWLGLPGQLELVLDGHGFGSLQVNEHGISRLLLLDGTTLELGKALSPDLDQNAPPHRLLDRRWSWGALSFRLDPPRLEIMHELSGRLVRVNEDSLVAEVVDSDRRTCFGMTVTTETTQTDETTVEQPVSSPHPPSSLISASCSQLFNILIERGTFSETELRSEFQMQPRQIGEFKHVLMTLQAEDIDFCIERDSSQGTIYTLDSSRFEHYRDQLQAHGWQPK